MTNWKKSLIVFILFIIVLGTTWEIGFTQFQCGPCFYPWGASWLASPFIPPLVPLDRQYLFGLYRFPSLYMASPGYLNPSWPLISPAPTSAVPYQRFPNATIIFTSPTLTAITVGTGVILVGATTVLSAPTAVVASVPAVQTVANPAPAPLFGLLAILYASATLHGTALLSTANPLLFAYLSTLLL